MNYLDELINPVVINQRPYRNRPRLYTEHPRQQLYVQDANGFLVPATSSGAAVRRSNSQAGPKTAPIIINNTQRDDYSPERASRRRSYHDIYYSSDEYSDRAHSHERHRRSRSRGRHSSRHKPGSPSPSPVHDPETERRLQRLDELEQKEHEEASRQKFEEQRIIEEARKAKEAKELEAMKKLAIEEHNAKVLEEQMKQKQKEEEEEKAFNERMRLTLIKAGYSEDSIEKTLKGKKGEKGDKGQKIMDLTRPTYIKVHRKYLSPDTLDLYNLPWQWDDVSNARSPSEAQANVKKRDVNYIVIKRWIPEHEQDILFEHTQSLREGRRQTSALVEIKKEREKLLLVRKKSPGRRRSTSRGYVIARS
ncbi:MAG: hypothetical protein Q9195_002239 [Heterodermia aff. obscurata]